jgi:hypothetical protein
VLMRVTTKAPRRTGDSSWTGSKYGAGDKSVLFSDKDRAHHRSNRGHRVPSH